MKSILMIKAKMNEETPTDIKSVGVTLCFLHIKSLLLREKGDREAVDEELL